MAGVIGISSEECCVRDLRCAMADLQHRAQDYCGMALFYNGNFSQHPERGLVKQQFNRARVKEFKGNSGIGVVANYRQPMYELGKIGRIALAVDGYLTNGDDVKKKMFERGAIFASRDGSTEIRGEEIISKIIAGKKTFKEGIEGLTEAVDGDFALVGLTEEGVYAVRFGGKKPLVLGVRGNDFAVSSESNVFENIGFKLLRDVKPGEVILLNKDGAQTITELRAYPAKYDSYEWVHNAHPASVLEGNTVAVVRENIGRRLGERNKVEADIVSPIPNSGRCYASGFANSSGIVYREIFVKAYAGGRNASLEDPEDRAERAITNLIPIREFIEGKRIILLEDVVLHGIQTSLKVDILRKHGAKEVHLVVGSPPMKHFCGYRKNGFGGNLLADSRSTEEIKEKLGLDSLSFATVEDLEETIGMPREKLCFECWGV